MEYELQVRGAWNRLRAESTQLADVAGKSLAEYHQIALALSRTKFPPLMQASIDDIRQQLRRLMPVDFLLAHPKAWVEHLPRYLKAVNLRLAKLTNAGLKRDCDHLLQIAERWHRYEDLKKSMRIDEVEPPDVERYRWLIEEFRVQLYAQELKTSTPVSAKRLDDLWQEIEQRHGKPGLATGRG